MRVICSYCQSNIRSEDGGRATDVSHGMCESCASHFQKLWEGMGLGEYLDELPGAVIVVDADARILAANAKAAAVLGPGVAEPRGRLAGDAVACSRSRLPGGCGKTVHCRDCAIRNTVTRVAQSGRPVSRVSAYLETDAGRRLLRVSARSLDGAVEVTLEDEGKTAA